MPKLPLKRGALKLARRVAASPLYRRLLRPLVKATLRLLFGRNGLPVNIGGTGVFRLSPDYYFWGWERFGEAHNSGFHACIEQARQCSVFLDVGAHIGLYSLPVSRALRPGGCVYAFEPTRSCFQYLLEHIAYNEIANIEVYPLIVADRSDREALFFEHTSRGSPLSGLVAFNTPECYLETRREQVSLDAFCTAHQLEPDLIKIDVEGAEVLVLQGGQEIIKQCRPVIFLSVHPRRLDVLGSSVQELARLIDTLGYQAFEIEGTLARTLGSWEYVLRPRAE